MTGPSIRVHLDRAAERRGDAPFLIDPVTGRTVGFGEAKERAAAIAGFLSEAGLKPGERVGYAMPNGVDTALAILGILYGGFCATAINLVAGRDTTAYVLEHSGVKLVFTAKEPEEFIREIAGLAPGRPRVELFGPGISGGASSGHPHPADDALLMYTSGTTGRPKGVLHSHASLFAGGTNTVLAHGLTGEDRALCVLPLYHINGLCVTLMGPLASESSVVLPRRYSTSEFWPTIRQHGCTWFSVVPTQISHLLHAEGEAEGCDALRFGRSASAPLSPDVHRAFEMRFGVPIIETMGLTETAAPILSNPMPPGERKFGSPGIAFGNEVRIADNDLKSLPAGEEGEIVIRGPNVMKGYLDNPEATAEALSADGWLRSGDLGQMDDEGYVFVAGRIKELIIKGGENISPREVDEALYAHPAVVEAAAFGVACPRYGERVEAAVVVKAGAVGETALRAICEERLGPFKAPDRVHIMEELPKGPSGKIQRRLLAERFAGAEWRPR